MAIAFCVVATAGTPTQLCCGPNPAKESAVLWLAVWLAARSTKQGRIARRLSIAMKSTSLTTWVFAASSYMYSAACPRRGLNVPQPSKPPRAPAFASGCMYT